MRYVPHLALALLLAAVMGAGCSEEGSLYPNQPPETFLFVDEGAGLDTTHYRQAIHWHGEDADGEVLRYEFKWTLDPVVPAAGFDTSWVGVVAPFVTATDSVFYLPVPVTTGAGRVAFTHHFQVRAVDNDGAADPTPVGAAFSVENEAPHLWAVVGGDTTSTLSLPDTILPVLSLQFRVADPDAPAGGPGSETAYIEEIRFWLEDSLDYVAVAGSDTLLTLTAEDFGTLGRDLTVHLQAVDLGGGLSNVLSASTHVRDVSGMRVLILDSCDTHSGYGNTADAFWASVAALFPAGEVYRHDFETAGPLGLPADLHAIFSLFEAVLWYNGDAGAANSYYVSVPTAEISEAEAGLCAYLEDGGKALLTGWNLVGASVSEISGGSLSADFETDVLMLDSLYVHDTTISGDNTSNRRLYPGREIFGYASAGTDTLRNMSPLAGIDLMAPDSLALASGTTQRLYLVKKEDVELVLLVFPISLAHGYGNNLTDVEGFLHRFGVLR
jgi:hypothetical protein